MEKHGFAPILASIDLGSHTARMLIAQWIEEEFTLKPLLRKRSYVLLGKDFEAAEAHTIKGPAVDRAILCLKEFKRISEVFDPSYLQAVATGVLREAANRDDVIRLIREETNLSVRLLSGEEEAKLSGLGVSHSLGLGSSSSVIFDLGGGSTEFLIAGRQSSTALSLPLGAALLTERYLVSDPPLEEELGRAKAGVMKLLKQGPAGVFQYEPFFLIGTGGTVTTLAAMAHGINTDAINPARMNGLVLERNRIEALFSKMSRMTLGERLQMPGLDQGRAEVILGGTLAVLEILKHFDASETMISLSDLLEGVLFERLGYALPGDSS
jgi:exopolyphosphatase / guanosine-5'-triphosphate,3'-diphosphate pyrophosphatase